MMTFCIGKRPTRYDTTQTQHEQATMAEGTSTGGGGPGPSAPLVSMLPFSSGSDGSGIPVAPQWAHDFVAFRQRLFLAVVEPVIVTLFGPVDPHHEADGLGDGSGGVYGDNGYRMNGLGGATGSSSGDGGGSYGLAQSSSASAGASPVGPADVGDNNNNSLLDTADRMMQNLMGLGNSEGLGGDSTYRLGCDHHGYVSGPCYDPTTGSVRQDAQHLMMMAEDDEFDFSAAESAPLVDANHRRLGFLPAYIDDVSSFRETSMSFATLMMLFTIMSCLMIVFLSCFYHNQKTSPLFISPRRHRLPKLVPPPLPVDRFFSWIKVILFMSDEEIINRIGYDALIFLRFHRLALRCIVKMSVFSFIVILPLNFTGGGHANASDLKGYVGTLLFTDFMRFTMANVSGGSPRLWVHCFAAYLLTAIVVRELLVEYNAFHNIRHRYLLSKEPHLRTVMVSNIPRHLRAPSKISTYFQHVYPEAVKSVAISQNLIRLESLVKQRTSVMSQIEKELFLLCRTEKRKLIGQTGAQWIRRVLCSSYLLEKMGLVQGAQDRLTRLYSELEDLNEAVEKEKNRRRRVMKRLDKLEAGEGRKDIDYILATPFVGEQNYDPARRGPSQIFGSPTEGGIGASRNPDGSMKTSSYNPPTVDCSTPANTGPVLRPSAAAAVSSSGGGVPGSDAESVVSSSANTDIWSDDKKHKPRSLTKAKSAIRRYSKLVAGDVSFFGQPVSGVDAKFVQTPANGNPNVRGHIEDHTNEVCDKAFVQMRTFTASTIAIQSMHSARPGAMQVTTAPEPRDVIWSNIYVSKGAKRTRSYIGELFVLLLICFYVVPVALVSLLVSESALISSSPRLAQLDQASALFSTGIAMVQPICLVAIQQILPPLFLGISIAEGTLSFSEVQMKAFSRYFLFQVLNIFLVTAVAGTIFDTLAIIVENPETAFELLGNSLPRMSSFFITYAFLKTFLGLGLELVRLVSLVQQVIRFVLFPNSTLREKRSIRMGMRAIDDPGWFPFHKILAQDMLVVVVSVVFAVVAPIVLFPCAMFCLFSRILWTHHHLYVYESVFETGGQFWPKIFRRFVFGLIVAQMTITGQFILKEARHEAYATIALMIMTYIFLRSTRARYDAPSSTLPLEVATVMDISLSQEEEAIKGKAKEAVDNHARKSSHSSSRVHFEESSGGDGQGPATSLSSSQQSGTTIGQIDPFEQAYLQPALRSHARARPEQPFSPAQLGREEVFLGKNSIGESLGVIGEEAVCDTSATVRLRCLNQQDRKAIDEWWKYQIRSAGKQNKLRVLIGEESGTLQATTYSSPLRKQKANVEGGSLV